MNPSEIVKKKIKEAFEKKSKLLNLSHLDIKEIPKELSSLKRLQILNLKNNKIKDLSKLPILNNLQVIYLSNNLIEEIPDNFFELQELKVIDLSSNKISKIPNKILKIKKLKRLFISGNTISNLPKEMFNLTTLEHLDLAYNKLTKLPESLEKLINLESLTVYKNKLIDANLNFEKLVKLKDLNLSQNNLIHFPISIFSAKSLKHCELYSNKIENINLDKVTFKINDAKINLADNKITDLPNTFPKLKSLHLYFNPLKGNLLSKTKKYKVDEIFIDHSQIPNFIIDNKTTESIKIINDADMKVRQEIYKTIPHSIEDKYKLISRRRILLERLKNRK